MSCICPSCGSDLTYDDGRDAWTCLSCGFLGPNDSVCPKPGDDQSYKWTGPDADGFYRVNTAAVRRVVAKYKEKKKNPNGGDPIYLYSEGDVTKRNKAKAERLEKLSGNIEKLRTQYRKDLKSDDLKTALVSLAVALIDETAERVGGVESTKGDNEDGKPHYGVTTWKKSHVRFKGSGATIAYVGKSGVPQKKQVTDKAIVTALRKAHKECSGEDLFCHDEVTIDASKVNAYLKDLDLGITAKDLRGFHANFAMKEELKKARAKGGKLPTDKKEREDKLKKEFKSCLEIVAKEVGGHTVSTLQNQYLVDSIEEDYLKDGSVGAKMTASVMSRFRG